MVKVLNERFLVIKRLNEAFTPSNINTALKVYDHSSTVLIKLLLITSRQKPNW